MKNFWKSEHFLRVLSVFISVLLWIFIVYQENPNHETYLRSVPVNCINLSSDFESGKYVIAEGMDTKVDLKLRGERVSLAAVKMDDVRCTLNFEGIIREGIYTLPVDVSIAVNGVSLVSKEPYSAQVVVDKVVTEEREIIVNQTGNPANGFEVGSVNISPQTIKLTGPKTLIDEVKRAEVLFDSTGITENVEGLYKIKLYREDGKEITAPEISKNVEYCDVKCELLSIKEINIVPSLSSEFNKDGKRISVVSVRPEKVLVKGKKEELEKISSLYTMPVNVYDVTEVAFIDTKANINNFPDNVEMIEVPDIITVELGPEDQINQQSN